MKPRWLDFWSRNFNEVPRLFWFIDHVTTYEFRSEYDQSKKQYNPFYTVSVRSWDGFKAVGACPVESVLFNEDKSSIDVNILEHIIFNQ